MGLLEPVHRIHVLLAYHGAHGGAHPEAYDLL